MNPLSIWDLIATREASATAIVDQLCGQIATLTEQLTAAETELADLATTRRTLAALTAGEAEPPPAGDATIASTAYQQILAAFTTAPGALRAKDVCHAMGLGVTPKDTEGIRAKLKRLVTRQILTETEPGLFALATQTPAAEAANRTPDPAANPKWT